MKSEKTPKNQPAKSFKEQISSSWKDASDALRNTPQAFKLVWQASKRHTLINFSLIPLIAVLPAAQSWVGKMIVDRILQAIDINADVQAGLQLVLPFVLFEFALLLVSTLLSSFQSLSNNILRSLLTRHVNTLIIDKSISLDLQFYEDPVFYDNMQNARRRADSSALAIVTSISQVAQQLITLISLVVLLVGFSPWLAVVVILAAVPNFLSNSRFAEMAFRALTHRAPEARLLSYIENLLTSNETVKEIKLFGLGESLKQRYEDLFTQFLEEDTSIARRNTYASLAWGMLSNLAYYGSYIWVIVRTITRAITLGDMTMFLSVFRQSQRAVQMLLENFSRLYENNLYLDNLLDFLKIEPALEIPENGKIAPAPILEGVRFENVSFKYPGSEKRESLHQTWRKYRIGRFEWRRQDHPDQAAHPALRPHRGTHHAGWNRSARL